MLRAQVDRNGNRLDLIDEHGTRGVAILAVQFADLREDLGEHLRKHDRAETDRAASRRIAIATASTLLLGNFSVLGWVIAHVH